MLLPVCFNQLAKVGSYLPRDAMYSADYAVARCLSVCHFVCLSHASILSKRFNISSNFYHHQISTTF